MSNSILKVRIAKSGSGFKGTALIPGLRPAMLERVSDKSTEFETKSGVTQSAKSLAKRNGWEVEFEDSTAALAKPARTRRTAVVQD